MGAVVTNENVGEFTVDKNDISVTPSGGIAIIPPKGKRKSIGVVNMGDTPEDLEHVTALSKQMNKLKMNHVVMTVKEAEAEGITRAELEKAQRDQITENGKPTRPNPMGGTEIDLRDDLSDFMNFAPKQKGTNQMPKSYKRKKKGKKSHRKKRK